MQKVVLYDDTTNILSEFDGVTVRCISDYVYAYQLIQQAIYNKNPLSVVVKDKCCLEYLKEMQKKYGEQYIILQVYSPKAEICDALDMSVPDYISDQDILESGLLKELDRLQFGKGMTFEDIILSNYLGQSWTLTKFPVKRIIEIVENDLMNNYGELKIVPLFKKIIDRKVEDWQKGIKEQHILNILNELVKDPQELYENMSKYVLLAKYPIELANDVLGPIADDFAKIDFVQDVFLNEKIDLLVVRDYIGIYLNSIDLNGHSMDEIIKYINMVTGYFIEEGQFIIDLLKCNLSDVDRTIINLAREKLKPLEKENVSLDEILENLFPPVIPGKPQDSFDIKQWLSWAIDEYLPYRFWLEENGLHDNILEQYSDLYGEWIFENYMGLLSSYDNMIYKALINLSQELKENEISLILVIDNFNHKYVSYLKDCFLENGFNVSAESVLLAMLPTETAISKRSFFSGEAYSYDNNKSYPQMCGQWENLLRRKVKYLSSVEELKKETRKQADIYILNHLEIDDILHKGQKKSALTTGLKVKSELKALAKEIGTFSRRIGYERIIKVYITSDHGSTKISKEQTNLINQNLYKGKCDGPSHRYVTVSDEHFKVLNNSIQNLCFVMDRNKFGTKENYLLAKKYYRFHETDDSFYVHGGITPEEMIIPLIKFEKVEATVIYPYIVLRNNVFRYSVRSKVIIEISNTNQYPVTDIEVYLTNNSIKYDGTFKIKSMNKLEKNTVVMDNVRITKGFGVDEKLNIKIKFNFLGKEYDKDYSFTVSIKAMQQDVIDFNDLL